LRDVSSEKTLPPCSERGSEGLLDRKFSGAREEEVTSAAKWVENGLCPFDFWEAGLEGVLS